MPKRAMHKGQPDLYPVRALAEWLDAAGIAMAPKLLRCLPVPSGGITIVKAVSGSSSCGKSESPHAR